MPSTVGARILKCGCLWYRQPLQLCDVCGWARSSLKEKLGDWETVINVGPMWSWWDGQAQGMDKLGDSPGKISVNRGGSRDTSDRYPLNWKEELGLKREGLENQHGGSRDTGATSFHMILRSLPLGPGPDINHDSADEMQPHGSLIRKSVISLSQRPDPQREALLTCLSPPNPRMRSG